MVYGDLDGTKYRQSWMNGFQNLWNTGGWIGGSLFSRIISLPNTQNKYDVEYKYMLQKDEMEGSDWGYGLAWIWWYDVYPDTKKAIW